MVVLTWLRYDQGVLGGLIALPSFLNANGIDPADADEQGTIVAIYDVGCFTGCLIMAFVGQKLGRRVYIILGGLLILLGGSLQAGAYGTAYLYAGRVIGGVGMGLCTYCLVIPQFADRSARFRINHDTRMGRRDLQSTLSRCSCRHSAHHCHPGRYNCLLV